MTSPAMKATNRAEEGPAYDRSELEARMGDVELAREIEDLFLATSADLLGDVTTAVAAGERARIQTAAHKLKGALANVGARRAASVAASVEAAAKAGDLTTAAGATDDLVHELRALERDIRRANG